MEQKEQQDILIQILYAAVNEVEHSPAVAQKLTPDVLEAVYRLAKKHDLAHVVTDFVYQNKIEVPAQLGATLQKEAFAAICRHEQMQYTLQQISDIFEKAGIAHIPLKGAVIRPYYPKESIRTSCDIDILIHEEDITAAVASLEQNGYRYGDKRYHDVSLYSPNNIHLELHFNILENMPALDSVLQDAWKYAQVAEGNRWEFKQEFFVFHMYAHMAYHFVCGGCGIRSLLDIWVMEHNMHASYTCAKNLLQKAGIADFAAEMSRIANMCFTDHGQDDFSQLVLYYIFGGGVFGTKQNSVAMEKAKAKNKAGYLLRKVFAPYQDMLFTYPILKKAPYLLPFCWIARWIGAMFGGKSKRIASEMVYANSISDEKIQEVKEICLRLGL